MGKALYQSVLNIVSTTVQVQTFILVPYFSFVMSNCISNITTIKSAIKQLLNYAEDSLNFHIYTTVILKDSLPQDWFNARGSSTLCQLTLCPLITHLPQITTISTVNDQSPFSCRVGVHETWQLQHAHLPPPSNNCYLKLLRGAEKFNSLRKSGSAWSKRKGQRLIDVTTEYCNKILRFGQFTLIKVTNFILVP